jgi:predicted outer membrane protein
VRKFAQMMIDDHTKMSAELKAAVQAGNVTAQIPMSLTGEKAQVLEQLSSKGAPIIEQHLKMAQKMMGGGKT